MSNVDDIVIDLLKVGFIDDAAALIEASTSVEAAGMTSDSQKQQMRFFEKAFSLSGKYVDESTLSMDPKKKVMSFATEGMNVIQFPVFLERLLRTLNKVGNTTYSLRKVRRNRRTVVEINIGK